MRATCWHVQSHGNATCEGSRCGMTPFEYVSVLLSIVVSLALAHLLIGIAKMIKVGISRWSIPLLSWIGLMSFSRGP